MSHPLGELNHQISLDEPPPFLGKWWRLYLAVILYLALMIAVFFYFTQSFAP